MIYEIEHPNIYNFIKDHLSEFDTSNFSLENPHGVPRENATVVLKMKSETADSSISEFIALGPKQYALKTADDQIIKKAKGVKKCVVKRHIPMDDYKNALFHNKVEKREQTTIQSKYHILHTVKRRKIAL